MSLRDDLAAVLARDPRYSIHAYAFVFESISYTKKHRAGIRSRGPAKARRSTTRHVTGRQLCEGACAMALAQYGYLAKVVLRQWGLRSTSDLGEVVYNLIASGDLEKTPSDSRSDFDGVFDLEQALTRDFRLVLDDVA
ncbi:MAG TPA: Minf_1886 family protein [Isosphaeraceae bacterium]|jgi:uncharacterized repeat protein (TIGR04138 family)